MEVSPKLTMLNILTSTCGHGPYGVLTFIHIAGYISNVNVAALILGLVVRSRLGMY